jgi:hypothetical protein
MNHLDPKYIYVDPIIGGWTDENVKEYFGFDNYPPEIRHRYTVGGPFSICREQRRGVMGFTVCDMRKGSVSLRCGRKAIATRIAKLIENDTYSDLETKTVPPRLQAVARPAGPGVTCITIDWRK